MENRQEIEKLIAADVAFRDELWKLRNEIADQEACLKNLRERLERKERGRSERLRIETLLAPVLIPSDELGYGKKRYPHCDQFVLHAPSTCRFCDELPELQAARERLGVNFTGGTDATKMPCPSELYRPKEQIERWPGNRPAGE